MIRGQQLIEIKLKFDAILDRDGTISHDPYGYANDVKIMIFLILLLKH